MMIIECTKCHSEFYLDEGLLREGGSKVRCSVCKNVFTAYPPTSPSTKQTHEVPDEEVRMEREPQILDDISLGDLSQKEEREEDFRAISPEELSELQTAKTAVMGTAVELAEELAIRAEEIKEEEEVDIKKGEKKKPSRSPLLMVVLLCVLLIMGGGVAVFLFAPDLIPISFLGSKTEKRSDVTDVGVSKLFFKSVNGTFSQTVDGKQRFVITGEVINNYPSNRSFILLMGSILDNKGQVLKRMSVYAGNTFTEKQIKELSIEEINKGFKNRFGRERTNFDIKPGGAVPFMIIFEDLNENMREFTVEGVSSVTGK